MKLNQFKVGDKVWVPVGTIVGRSRYSTIRYMGPKFALLEPEYVNEDTEFLQHIEMEGFELFKTEEDLRDAICRLTVLGRDLIAAIELSIPHHTPGKTPHMQMAIDNFREELRRV